MAKSTINLGTTPNDRTGDTLRDAGSKVNSNFSELYTALGNGTALNIAVTGATSGQVLKFNGTNFVPATDLNTDAVTSVNSQTGAVVLTSENVAEPANNTLLTTVVIAGTAGQFTCAATTLAVGQTVTITGTLGGTGTITGYTTGKVYTISVTNGTTSFTLTDAGSAIVTTTGTPTGLTYTPSTLNVYFSPSRARNVLSATSPIGYSASTGVISFSGNSDNVSEGSTNQYYTAGRFDFRLSQKTTADLAEGANLYFTNTRARLAISSTGSINYNQSTGVISYTGPTDVTVNRWYVDAARTDTYTATGTSLWPFKTISAAITAIQAAITATTINPATNPVFIIIRSNITETVNLTIPHVFLVGENGGIHTPISITGAVTITAPSGTLTDNHFAITGLQIVGPSGGNAVRCTGTNPTRLFMQDVWLVASGTGTGYLQDCTGAGTIANGDSVKVSHSGTGDVYCFDITKGSANFVAVETSGATQVGAVRQGASLSFSQSELDANGDVVCETYGTGTLTITLSSITNIAANSNGIKINDAGGTAVIGNSLFNIPAGSGKAVTGNAAGTLVHAGNIFAYGSNTAKTTVASLALPSSFT